MLFLFLHAILIAYLFHFLLFQGDAESYIAGARYLFGLEGGADMQYRVTKPLAIFLPGLLEYTFGIEASWGFLLQNLIAFFLTGIFLFKTNFLLFQNQKQTLLSVIAYMTCAPFLIYSLMIMTDILSWMFIIASIYFIMKYFSSFQQTNPIPFLIGLLMGIGFLTKENVAAAPLFLLVYTLRSNYSTALKSKVIITSALGFLLPVIISSVIIYFIYDRSLFMWFYKAHSVTNGEYYKLSVIISQTFRVMDMFWLLFALGFFRLLFLYRKNQLAKPIQDFLLASVAGILLIPIWPYQGDRFYFMVAPFLITVVMVGATYLNQYGFGITILGAVLNIALALLTFKYNIHGMLLAGFIFYSIVLIVVLWLIKTEKSKKLMQSKGL